MSIVLVIYTKGSKKREAIINVLKVPVKDYQKRKKYSNAFEVFNLETD